MSTLSIAMTNVELNEITWTIVANNGGNPITVVKRFYARLEKKQVSLATVSFDEEGSLFSIKGFTKFVSEFMEGSTTKYLFGLYETQDYISFEDNVLTILIDACSSTLSVAIKLTTDERVSFARELLTFTNMILKMCTDCGTLTQPVSAEPVSARVSAEPISARVSARVDYISMIFDSVDAQVVKPVTQADITIAELTVATASI